MEKKKKLLFVAEEMAVNGAMMSLLSLLQALPTDKYDISLFLFEQGGFLFDQLPEYVHVLPEKVAYSVHHLSTKLAIRKALEYGRLDLILYRILLSVQRRKQLDYKMWWWLPDVEGTYDVVCCYCDGFVAPMIQHKVTSGKKCCWIHFPYTYAPLMKYEYEALKTADACVTVSKTVGEDLNRALGCKSAPQYLVHNIIDVEYCQIRANELCEIPFHTGVFRIVSVGRITPQKGFDIICPTAKLLVEYGINFEWYIIGEGEDREKFIKQSKQMGLNDNVFFVGNKNNPMPLVKSADVVVQPSVFESWGMTVSEALCLGKFVIVSDLPVFAEQIIEGVNGFMRPLEPELMASAIKDVFENKIQTKKKDKDIIEYPFTKSNVVREFNTMICELLKRDTKPEDFFV